jgi:hypothetical protein
VPSYVSGDFGGMRVAPEYPAGNALKNSFAGKQNDR